MLFVVILNSIIFQNLKYYLSYTMSGFPAIKVPAYEFYFNLVVCPNPYGVKDVSLYTSYYVCKRIYCQGSSSFVILSNNEGQLTETGGTHWLRFLPDHIYCFLPSFSKDNGEVQVLDHLPSWLVEDFLFCKELDLAEVGNDEIYKTMFNPNLIGHFRH